MKNFQQIIGKIYRHFMQDSLYRNSIYLILSTATLGFFGFFFWLVCAHLFSTSSVGLAVTLISILTLIAELSLLGFNNTLIRYLPKSKSRNENINTVILLVSIVAILISVVYIIGIKALSPELSFVRSNPFYVALFLIFAMFMALNFIIESVFIAYRSSYYILVKNVFLGIVKCGLPLFFVSLGAYGIFMSSSAAILLAVGIGFYFLVRNFKFSLKFILDKKLTQRVDKFTLANYISNLFMTLPALVLPAVITHDLGPNQSAYFYIDMMFANILYVIPLGMSQSFFAEGAYEPQKIKEHLIHSLRGIFLLLLPASVLFIIISRPLLSLYGHDYVKNGQLLYYLLMASSFFMAFSHVGSTVLNLYKKGKWLVYMCLWTTFLILITSSFLLKYGLYGVGLGWAFSYFIAGITYCVLIYWLLKFKTSSETDISLKSS